jgi:ketol-acid reductoisomerase
MIDGFVPGKTLFEIEAAVQRGTVIQYLLSDAAQKICWSQIKRNLKSGDALYFSHGFSIVYNDLTKIVPPEDVDVILVAPKGSGLNVRCNFLSGAGTNSSFGVYQDATGNAEERCMALGIGIGSGYLFSTSFEKEVTSDLVGERGVLMGALSGVMEAQYDVLRKNGHSPSEAFNETVEELTQSLIRLVDENGMDWMFSNCSATAQRGALDWAPEIQESDAAGLQRPLQSGQDQSGSQTRSEDLRSQELSRAPGCRTESHSRLRNVAGGRCQPLAPPEGQNERDHQRHQGCWRPGRKLTPFIPVALLHPVRNRLHDEP